MKAMFAAALLGAAVLTVRAAPDQTHDAVERGTLRLHYLQKPIGEERYEIVRDGDGLRLTSDFDFTDRGGRVQLAATLRTAADYTPRSFQAKGKSYRFVNVDSDVTIDGREAQVRADGGAARVRLPEHFYTVDGYAPFAAQMLLLRYWKQHGQPRVVGTVPGLPVNDVFIEARGRNVLRVAGKRVTLSRFVVDGVVWGRETIWLDEHGVLAAAITRAGGLSFEAVRDDLEPVLLEFVTAAATDRIDDLERGLRIVKALHDAGVPVVVGTDEGIPGHSVHREIELYVEAGLTPMQALQAATIVPARAMKLDAELGTIERGKRADLVVLNANPLEAIRNIRSVHWTIGDGRIYDAAALWKSVRFQP